MLRILAILFLLYVFSHHFQFDQAVVAEQEKTSSVPIVALENGDILEGFEIYTASGARARVFLGVPYAQPPVGPMRFQKPRPIEKSSNATNPRLLSCLAYKSSCWQNHSNIEKPITDLSEDCLYLNIFIGTTCNHETKCPVVYYIHGGAFEFDSPSMFPAEVLAENFATHGLAFITVAYRLGVLGFWSLGSGEAVGNYGLYDLIEGLKWVKREIAAFGGDPDRVVIMGHSSGAGISSLFTLSPKTYGLFDGAIIMSGTPTLSEDLTRYRRLAEDVGCARKFDWLSDHKYDEKIVECMRRVPPDQLTNLNRDYEDNRGYSNVSPLLDGRDGLFPLPLDQLMQKRRNIDVIIGTTNNEAGYDRLLYPNASAASVARLCEETMETKLIRKNKRLLTLQCQRLYVAGALEEVEFRNRTVQDANRKFSVWTDKTAEFENDVFYYAPTFKEATSLAEAGGNVYLYSFDYVKKGYEGVGPWHAFDLTYLTGIHPFQFDDRDYLVKSIYVPLFVNFVMFRNPTPSRSNEVETPGKWTPLRTFPMDMNYFSIDLPHAIMKKGYHYESVLFWDFIVPVSGGLQKPTETRRFVKLLTLNSSRNEEESTKTKHGGANWGLPYWVTVGVTVSILLSAVISAFIIVKRCSREWMLTLPCGFIQRREPQDEETLALSMKPVDSYATFY